tara:strand:+ start:10407 stop:11315 length:909 start_codon:yes stop_codon:yes gene_type:complete
MKNLYLIQDEFINTRLDRWLKKKVCKVPQSLIEKNIRKGNIKVNGKKNKSSYKLKKNDEITIKNLNFKPNISQKKTNYIPTRKDLSSAHNLIIENNENFVIINKPAGIAVQQGTKSKKNILDILGKMKEFDGLAPFPVHRIDKETTGILIVAKNRNYAQLFTTLFRIRKIYKVYLGLIFGNFDNNKGTLIDDLFYYEGKKQIKTRAITHYTVIDSNNHYSLVKLIPQTGRKHQIRKQLLIHGCPIVGDSKYRITEERKKSKNNLMLHAHKISFLINNTKYQFTAQLPDNFNKFLKEKNLKPI